MAHEATLMHMKDCDACRRAEWDRRGGHPVKVGTTSDERTKPVAFGRSSTSPKVEKFLTTGDPSVFDTPG